MLLHLKPFRGRFSPFWILLFGLLHMSLQAAVLEMPSTTEVPDLEKKSLLKDMDIPGVKEREPSPDAGPRLNVTEFRIQGLVEYPELGITRADLVKRVEAIRFELMSEGEKTKSGYTLKELAEMADLVAEIEEETKDQHVGPVDVQKLVFLIREQRRKRGVTLGMIETVADTITQYYRERGFILAKAYIPQQQVRDGVVSLEILLGKLGSVEVNNNRRYRARTLAKIFNSSLDKPVTAAGVEENLYLINDLPGVYVQGYFEPGTQVGDTRLKLNVTKETWFDTSIRFDNHGAATTGENRLYGEFVLHNPSTLGDQLQLGVLATEKDSAYGSVRYSIPVYNPRIKLAAGYSKNDFVSRLGAGAGQAGGIEFSGKSTVIDADLSYQIKRGRKHNSSVAFNYAEIDTELRVGDTGTDADKVPNNLVDNLKLNYHFDYLNEGGRSLHQMNIALVHAKETPDATAAVTDEEKSLRDLTQDYLSYDYSLLTFIKNPLGKSDLRLVVNHSLQYAGKPLASVNQFDLSGPSRARGFAINHFVADDAAHVAADIIFATPSFLQFGSGENASQDGLTPFILSDIAYGQSHPQFQGSGVSKALLADVGLGLKLSTPWGIRGNFALAVPVTDNIKQPEGEAITTKEKSSYHVYAELMYSF